MDDNFIGENLKRIRLLKHLSLKEAGLLLNMSATGISKYEKGDIVPNSAKLIEFANAYNVKAVDLLEVYEPVKLNFNSFRKRKKLTGEKLELLKEIIQKKVSDYMFVISESNISKTKIFEKFDCDKLENAENIAYMFRKKLGFSNNQPIYNLIDTLENLGIIIIQIPNSEKLFDGFDGLSETINNTPIIIIRDDIVDGARQRFTICHELGHLLLNIKNGIDEEKACNVFASSLLMPKEAIINEFGPIRKNISLYELYQFKREYKVSVAAILYRLKELNVISEYFYKLSNIKLSKNNLKTNEVENITPEQTYQFKKLVHRLCIDELISIDRACELLGVSLDEYNIEDNYYKY